MRKGLFPVFCSLVLASLFAARCRAQAAPKLAPELRAFVKEDAPLVALTHVRVIDGTGAAPRADQTLVIREGKIASLGDRASTKIPEGAKRSEEHTSELQSHSDLVCRLLLEKKNKQQSVAANLNDQI